MNKGHNLADNFQNQAFAQPVQTVNQPVQTINVPQNAANDINFQKASEQKPKEEHSMGSLLLGAIFGGVSDELNMVMDTCEAASEFHTYNDQKQQKNNAIELGKKNSLGGVFAKGMQMQAANDSNRTEPTGAEVNGYQKRYTPKYQPGMKMAA